MVFVTSRYQDTQEMDSLGGQLKEMPYSTLAPGHVIQDTDFFFFLI